MLRVCVFLSVIWIENGRKFAENESERKEKEETRWAKKTTICWKQKKTIYTDISIEIAAFFSLSPCRHIDIKRLEWALELTSGRWASHTDWHVTRNVDWDEKAKLNIWIIFVWTFHEKNVWRSLQTGDRSPCIIIFFPFDSICLSCHWLSSSYYNARQTNYFASKIWESRWRGQFDLNVLWRVCAGKVCLAH